MATEASSNLALFLPVPDFFLVPFVKLLDPSKLLFEFSTLRGKSGRRRRADGDWFGGRRKLNSTGRSHGRRVWAQLFGGARCSFARRSNGRGNVFLVAVVVVDGT